MKDKYSLKELTKSPIEGNHSEAELIKEMKTKIEKSKDINNIIKLLKTNPINKTHEIGTIAK